MHQASTEDLFWISETYYRAVHADELRSLCCCLLVSAGSLLWQARLPALYVGPRLAVPVLLLCAGVLQRYWFCRSPTTFLKHRRTVRLVNRIVRSIGLIFTPIAARAALRAPPSPSPSLKPPLHPTPAPHPAATFLDPYPTAPPGHHLPRVPFALKQLMMLSGATMLIGHSLHTTLPPRPQAALHAASTLALLAYHTAPIAAIFAATPYAADLRATCRALNMVLSLGQLDLPRTADIAAAYDRSCHEHAEQLLAMFVILYFGAVVPVYLAVRIEHRRRRQFQLEIWLSHAADSLAADDSAGLGATPTAAADMRGAAVSSSSTSSGSGAGGGGHGPSAGGEAGNGVGQREGRGGGSGVGQEGGGCGVVGRSGGGVGWEVVGEEQGWALVHDAEEDCSLVCLYDAAMAGLLAVVTWGLLVHCREWVVLIVLPL